MLNLTIHELRSMSTQQVEDLRDTLTHEEDFQLTVLKAELEEWLVSDEVLAKCEEMQDHMLKTSW
jgi:hypothetical protein